MNNDDNRTKMLELLKLLETKKIDQDTFDREYAKLTTSTEFIENMRKTSRKQLKSYQKRLCIGFCVLLILFFAYRYVYSHTGREYIVAKDFGNLNQPVQKATSGTKTIKVGNVDVHVNFLYEYRIRGKVLATHNYLPTSTDKKLGPVDVGIAWGYAAKEAYFKNIRCIENGNRGLICSPKKEIDTDIEGLYSNNHLVPSNDKVRKQIKKIRKGDYIQIEGYLSEFSWGNGAYWGTSTTREDTGDHACETIFVTDVKWLKEK